MLHRKGMAGFAACAALACAGVVNGQTADTDSALHPYYLQATQPASEPASAPASAPATPPKPLMGLLEKTPVGTFLDNANTTVGGYIDAGFTFSDKHAPGNVITGRVFDSRNEHIVLDQLDFSVDRPVDYGKAAQNHTIDIGGHVDFILGWDSGLIHSSGIFDSPAVAGVASGFYGGRADPENQFDMTQAYIDFALPVGSGLRVRVGKFVTLLGYEVINPTGNPFYSHSYMFGFAIPFTQTGVIGEYKFNDDWLLDAGITRGWNQSTKDNNGDPDLLAGVTYTPQESDFLKKWKFILNLSEGPQATHDNGDWWTVFDFQAVYTATDKLTLALNIDYGDAPHAAGPAGTAQWYGVAGYGAYVLNDYFTLNGRAEWYGDNKGFTLGAAGNQNVYEFTVGVAIKPFPSDAIGQNFVIRPELRVDYSDKKFLNSGTDHQQATIGVDAYFIF